MPAFKVLQLTEYETPPCTCWFKYINYRNPGFVSPSKTVALNVFSVTHSLT